MDCDNLENITLPMHLTQIGEGAFEGCKSLTSVVIPDNVEYICDNAFAHCTSLTDVVIPESVRVIGCKAFHQCTNLKNLSIPDSAIVLDKNDVMHNLSQKLPFVFSIIGFVLVIGIVILKVTRLL